MKLTKENIKFVKRCAAEAVGITLEFMEAPTRKRKAVVSRQLVMYYFRKTNPKFEVSLAEIGAIFKKDHATALHSFNSIAGLKEQHDEETYKAKELFLYLVNLKTMDELIKECEKRDKKKGIQDRAKEEKLNNLKKYSALYKKTVVKLIRTEDEPPTERDFKLLEHILEY